MLASRPEAEALDARPMGELFDDRLRLAVEERAVAVGPGATALTVMLAAAHFLGHQHASRRFDPCLVAGVPA